MSKDDDSSGSGAGGGGLLSKVVRFVRNPTVQWSELDDLDSSRESQYSKQMLKEMIERKRRNDFIRRREFDQLRKLRQREALTGQRPRPAAGGAVEDTTPATDFSSTLNQPEAGRADTLKKIDEIEAQMSQQWWRGKQPAASASPASAPGALAGGQAFAPTVPMAPAPAASAPAEPLFPGAILGAAPPAQAASTAFVHEPDLEEAAIRFASGDHAGAEAALLDVLAQHVADAPERQTDIWMTLFDLYRATGQHDRFDQLGIDFAAQFGRSAPLWFSLPEQLGAALLAPPPAQASVAGARQFQWTAPAHLTLQGVAALQSTLARTPAPWMFGWARLTAIEETALAALAQLFTQWADAGGVQIAFTGVAALQALLADRTPSGDRTIHSEWWQLRMAALRLMGRADEFELVALDYCVTYEVSPPSWAAPRCAFVADDGTAAGAAAVDGPDSDLLVSVFGEPSRPAPLDGTGEDGMPLPALSGQVDGDASALLAPLAELARPGVPLAIACDRLIRMDFAAAGSVLNWAAAQQAQGREVRFVNLHRLVAVLFNVIGINEHAAVIPRKN
ncbi:MAG: STAS domain-containing protein [Acidovorax sp.]